MYNTWRQEQIAAIIGDVFCRRELAQASPELTEFISLQPLPRQQPLSIRHRYSLMKKWRELLPTKTRIVFYVALAILVLLYREYLG